MSTGAEARDVEGPTVKWAIEHGWLHLKITPLGSKGWPDQLFFGYPRTLVMIEFKAPGHKPKPIQTYRHGILRACGWPVYVVTSKEQGIDILKRERTAALMATTPVSAPRHRDDGEPDGGRFVPGSWVGKD